MSTGERGSTLAFVQKLINGSPHKVHIIPRNNRDYGIADLFGVAGVSTLGTIIDQTGGIVVADGIIRHLGGENSFGTSLRELNKVTNQVPTAMENILLIAYDVFGGWFAIDMAASNPMEASIHYLPPEAFTWVDTGIGHTAFFEWSLSDAVNQYYADYKEIIKKRSLPGDDSIISFSPPLWSEAGEDGKRRASTISVKDALSVRIGIIDSLKGIR